MLSPEIERLQAELDEKIRQQEGYNVTRGLLFGALFSLPFWALVGYEVWKGVLR